MSASQARLRVIGVSVPDVSDWREHRPAGRWSQFFGALAARTELVGTVRPLLSRPEQVFNLAMHFHPSRTGWSARAGFNLRHANRLSDSVGRQLQSLGDAYDLVVQLQTLCEPGFTRAKPYVIYTDNTLALTQRLYPEWTPLPEPMVRRWLEYEASVCDRALAVYTFSEFARRSVIEDYGSRPDRVTAIGAGANHVVDQLGDKQYDAPVALFVGSPLERKGGFVLLEAWPQVRSRVPGAELVIVGPTERPPRTLPPGVRWLGRLDRDRLDRIYREATVFVLPSLFEPWGHVFVEAMGHGLACIGTTACAMPEIIEDGLSGRLVAPGSSESLAEALIELLGDLPKAESMGRRGHTRVHEQMTWGHVADRLLADLGRRERHQRAGG